MAVEEEEIIKLLPKFKALSRRRVEFAEVDSVGIAHNIRFLYWMESGRTGYLRDIGIKMSLGAFLKEFPVMVVHNEIDYYNPARFNDELEILTRISKMGKSSFEFESVARLADGTILAKSASILVYLNPVNNKPERIPGFLREKIRKFEGDDVIVTE